MVKMDGMLSNLVNTLKNKNIFERDRKATRTRALGILLYHLGLSLRKTRTVISSFESVSHEAIRKWYLKAENIFSLQERQRNAVAIDETKIKIQGEQHIVWAAIDIQSWEVLKVWISPRTCSGNRRNILKFLYITR
ncbi:MAG: hypothetical protein ACLFU5_00725 [Thermoplasmata archaeon]